MDGDAAQRFGARMRELRDARGCGQRELAAAVFESKSQIGNYETGKRVPDAKTAALIDDAVGAGGELVMLASAARSRGLAVLSPLQRVEVLRHDVTSTITATAMNETALEVWEQTVLDHGAATRDKPAALLLTDLVNDFEDLSSELPKRHSASSLRRLTAVTARMAGLIFLTLIKLDERDAARRWARTARVAAGEAGDTALVAWVRAQEAYVHYYSGDLTQALEVARHAQQLMAAPSVGGALAAALEARAEGLRGQPTAARSAIDRAELMLSGLPPDQRAASAFGYNEAQLRFHQGNALTHLGETEDAWEAGQRALELYPTGDYLDRTLVRLDRAECLVRANMPDEAAAVAARAVRGLTFEQRADMILNRGREIINAMPPDQRELPAARDLRDVLASSREDPDAERGGC